jgi:hypothetical protein
MTEASAQGIIRAEDGQYLIEGGPDRVDAWPDPVTAITTGEADWIAVLTGTHHGPVNVTAQLLDARPAAITGQWDMVVERDLTVTFSAVLIINHYRTGPPISIPTKRSVHRVRVHARGRDEAIRHNILEDPVEDYLIQLWPVEEPRQEEILVGPDRAAALILE